MQCEFSASVLPRAFCLKCSPEMLLTHIFGDKQDPIEEFGSVS